MLDQGTFGCIFRPYISCNNGNGTRKGHGHGHDDRNDDDDGDDDDGNDFVTKLSVTQNLTFEIQIAEIVKTWPLYYHYFAPIETSCIADMKDLKNQRPEEYQDCLLTEESTKLTKSAAKSSDINETEFSYGQIRFAGHDNIEHDNNIKIPIIKDWFEYLSNSLKILKDNGIIHFDLKANNIMIHDIHHMPVIIDFGISINIHELETENDFSEKFYSYSTDYTPWGPDICLISYLVSIGRQRYKKKRGLLSSSSWGSSSWGADIVQESHIIQVSNDFIAHPMFQLFTFTDYEKDIFREKLRNEWSCWINKKMLDTCLGLVKSSFHKWDTFALCCIFQQINLNQFANGYKGQGSDTDSKETIESIESIESILLNGVL